MGSGTRSRAQEVDSVGLLFLRTIGLFSGRPQSRSLVLLIPLLLPLGPNRVRGGPALSTGPRLRQSQRHVACLHQNLTEVPTGPSPRSAGQGGVEEDSGRSLGWHRRICHYLAGEGPCKSLSP